MMARPSYGDDVKARVKRLFEALLAYINHEFEDSDKLGIEVNRQSDTKLVFRTQLRILAELTARDKYEGKLTKAQVGEALNRFQDFLQILEDNRTSSQGSENWHFTLKLWYKDKAANLQQFDIEWDNKRPPKSKAVAKGKQDTPPTIKENLPPAVPSERFVGREEELQKLHQQLQTSQQVAIVAVAGMGGVGKTELATQYAKQHLQNYPGGVCWLSAQGIDVGIQILRFAELKFNIIAPDDWELIDRVKFCWETWELGEVLLVFDNVTDYKQVQCYQPESPRFKLLLTTRFEFDSTLQQLRLGVLKPLAAMKLLKLLVGRERLQKEAWFARKICKFLGYLPLALELVGRYLMKMPDLSLETLLKRLDKKRLEHEAIAKANPLMLYQYGVAEAFELSWEQLDENAQGLGCWLSLYALADIPYSVEGMEDDEEQELLEKAIRDLRELHLLERINKGIYRLHPLIRQFFQMKLDESSNADEVKTAFVAKMVEIAKQIDYNLPHDLVKKFFSFIPHLAEVVNYLGEYISDGDSKEPFTGLGSFYMSQGLYDKAKPWLEKRLEFTQVRFNSEHLAVAGSLNDLGWLNYKQGNYTDAEHLYQQALEMKKRVLEEDNPSIATALHHLAMVYEAQNRYPEAEILCKQALAMRECLFGEEDKHIADSLTNLASLHYKQYHYTEAELLFKRALALYKKLLEPGHPHVAIVYIHLGNVYKSKNCYSEVEECYTKALEIRIAWHGKEHPDVAQIFSYLAAFYHSTKRYNKAKNSSYLQALEIYKRTLGIGHPNTMTA